MKFKFNNTQARNLIRIACGLIFLVIIGTFISQTQIHSSLTNKRPISSDEGLDEGVKDGEKVRMEYTLWIAPEGSGPEGEVNMNSHYQGPAKFIINVTRENLIYGYYLAVLGMRINDTKTFSLPANNDTDEDGFDDITGEEVLSYGSPESPLFNTNIRFKVTIIKIYREIEEPDTFSIPSFPINILIGCSIISIMITFRRNRKKSEI